MHIKYKGLCKKKQLSIGIEWKLNWYKYIADVSIGIQLLCYVFTFIIDWRHTKMEEIKDDN